MNIREMAQKYEEYVIEARHWLHQHAELAWEEYETTEYIAQQLRDMGLEPQIFDKEHTGLYAMICGGKAGQDAKTIMLRADIDALPTVEKTGVPYESKNKGVMHACGHDTHVAMLLGAAKILTEIKDDLNGNVKLLFQAAEETAFGAKYYLDQGVLEGVDAAYACHIATFMDSPFISVDPGPRAASTDEFIITVEGVASHGGMPHYGKDAIVAASAIVMNLQTIISRSTDSLDSLVITVGKINGGFNYNVVSDCVELSGTVRAYSKEIRDNVPNQMEEVIQNTAKVFGCTAKLDYIYKTGPVINDESLSSLAKKSVLKLYGPEGLRNCRPIGGGDDFAYFNERVPSVFAFIGARNEKLGCIYNYHHPKFNIDESVLKRGTAMFAQVTVDFLNQTKL